MEKLLTGAEAVLGQVHLVVFVAMIVGLFIQARHEPASDADTDEHA